MSMKVSFFRKELRADYEKMLSITSSIVSFLLLFYDIPSELKIKYFLSFVGVMLIVYVLMWFHANHIRHVELSVNNSTIEISAGDVFQSEGLKIIAFNEYFDTQVDENIISSRTLNGQFIKKYAHDVESLDHLIQENQHAQECKINVNQNRLVGKQIQYKLGTIVPMDDFFILAFSKFDNQNRAYLEMNDYTACLMNMWNECDIHYGGRSIVLPLLGSGITRFHGYENITDQELLEIILWTFKVSRIRFQYPSKAKIVLAQNSLDKIDLYKIKKLFKK